MKRKVVSKLLAVALSATMAFGLAACGGGGNEESSSSNSNTPASSQQGNASTQSSSTEPEKRTFSFDKMSIYLPGDNPNEYGGGNPAYDRLIDDINTKIFGEGSTTKLEWSFTIETPAKDSGLQGYYTIATNNLTVPQELADVTRWSGTPSTNAAFINAATGAGQTVVDTPAVYKKDADGKDTTEIETPAVTHIEAAGTEVFWDLAPYIELKNADGSYVYPNLAAWKPIQKLALNYYGKIYGLPLTRDKAVRNQWGYRLDWAKKNNIDVEPGQPVDLETFEKMLKAFTENDPDGDGQDNTVGLYLDSWGGAWDIMQLWWGAPNEWGLLDSDLSVYGNTYKKGSIIPTELHPGYKAALNKFREWYDLGYINQDFDTVGAGNAIKKDQGLHAGLGGINVQCLDGIRKVEIWFEGDGRVEANAALDDAMITFSPYVDTGLGGKCQPTANLMGGFIAISKLGNIKTEEQLKDALYVVDQLSDGWYDDLYSWGWVGEKDKENQQATYYLDDDGYANAFDGKPEGELTAGQAYGSEISKWSFGFNQIETFNYAEGHEPSVPKAPNTNPTQQLENEMYSSSIPYAVEDAHTGCVSQTYSSLAKEAFTVNGTSVTGLDAIVDTARVQYIKGEIDETALDAAIQQWLDAGMAQVIVEMNEQYASIH